MEKYCIRGPEYGARSKTNSRLAEGFFLWIVKLIHFYRANPRMKLHFFYPLFFSARKCS